MEMTNYLVYGEGRYKLGSGNPIYEDKGAAVTAPVPMKVVGLVNQVLPDGTVVLVRTFLTPVPTTG